MKRQMEQKVQIK